MLNRVSQNLVDPNLCESYDLCYEIAIKFDCVELSQLIQIPRYDFDVVTRQVEVVQVQKRGHWRQLAKQIIAGD